MTDEVIGGQRPSDNDHNHDTPDGQDPLPSGNAGAGPVLLQDQPSDRPPTGLCTGQALSGSDADESAEVLDSLGL